MTARSYAITISLLLAGMLATGAAHAGEAVRLDGTGLLRIARILALDDDSGFECIIHQEYSFAGLRLGEPMVALDRLGPPKRLTNGQGEDDGGGYAVYTYHYGGLAVEIVRGEIDVITATDGRWPTPSGIHIGMTRGDVYAALGRAPGPDYATDAGFSFPGCPSADGTWNDWMYFELEFNLDARLATIRLVTDRP